jgi:hypothetical protein
VFGVYAVVVGIAQVWLGLRMRTLGEQTSPVGATLGSAAP